MADQIKEYPDISYVDTDTDTITNALIMSYEKITGRTLYPADPARIFILWVADIIVQERVNIDFSAKQNIPRYAEGEYLDSLAELFKDVQRLQAVQAKTTLRYTISMVQESDLKIAAGTRSTPDGEIVFETEEDLIIPAGELFGDVHAICQSYGTAGNYFVPGQINKPIDVFPYFQAVENITETAGGADIESDEAFYERMRESMETFSTAGPQGGYDYYAKSASTLIADVKATSPSPGVVDVRVLLENGHLPGEETLQAVRDMLNADEVRPLTDNVIVAAPDLVPYDIDFTYYIQTGGPIGENTIKTNVNTAVDNFKKWQAAKMGRDINPSHLVYLLMQTGIKRVEVHSPVYATVADNAVAVVGSVLAVNGGTENE